MIAEQSANVVIIPVNAQVGQLQQLWLYKNGILGEEGHGIFTPVAVQAADGDVELLLLSNRFQIVGKRPAVIDSLDLAVERMRSLLLSAGDSVLGALTGIGTNFQVVWNLEGMQSAKTLLERVFVKEGTIVVGMSPERQVGLSVVEQITGARITTKLDLVHKPATGDPHLCMDINIHADLQDATAATAFLVRAAEFSELLRQRIAQVETHVIGERS